MAGKPVFKTADEVEAVFYEAFRHCDAEVMAALWADSDVVCVHPGSGAIVGHEAVARSWSHIFSNAQQPDINYTVAKRTQADGLAVHVVAEEISTGSAEATIVLATNVYEQFEQGWLMIAHHASLVQSRHGSHTLQ